jgi:tetratricopeptide (TPR) repeat protein
VAKVLIASGDLAGADRLLSEALQVGGAEIRPAIEQAQAHLRRQQGVTLLKQGKLKEAADLLSAATEQGLTDNVTRGALAVARFGLARARGAVQEMQAAADVLKHTLPPALAARVLIEIGCQQLRAASTMAAQQRGAAASQLRASLNPLLEQAANSFCEALRLDDAQHAVHYVLGRLAFYLLRNLKLALLHLAKAEALVAKIGLTDSTLGDVYLEVGQVFTAKRFFYMRWQSKQDADRALQSLRQVLSREAGLLRRFARDEAVPEEPSVVEESADIIERIQVLNHLAERLMINLPSDQQKQIRSLCSKLKMALVDRDSSKLEKLEQDLLAQLGPALVK